MKLYLHILCSILLICTFCLIMSNVFVAKADTANTNALSIVELITESKSTVSLSPFGKVGQTLLMDIAFTDGMLPSGAFPVIKVQCVDSTQDKFMHFLSGVPQSEVRFDAVGTYTLTVTVGFVLRSS